MDILKKTAGFIFALIAGILILISLIIVTPVYFIIFSIGGPQSDKTAHNLSRIWASYVLLCSGVSLKVYGKKPIDTSKTYVIVSNHRSHLDIPVCAASTSIPFKFLAKEELTKAPLLGFIIKKLYITVRRQSMRDRVNALKKMEDELRKGISVWIYPEGTRNKSEQPLNEFQDGAFTLAVNSGKPIIVLTVMDTREILQPGNLFQLIPGKVNAWWDGPIETSGLTRKDIPMLRDKVQSLMLNHIVKGEK